MCMHPSMHTNVSVSLCVYMYAFVHACVCMHLHVHTDVYIASVRARGVIIAAGIIYGPEADPGY